MDDEAIRLDAVRYWIENRGDESVDTDAFYESVFGTVDYPVGRAGLSDEVNVCLNIFHSSEAAAMQIRDVVRSRQFEE